MHKMSLCVLQIHVTKWSPKTSYGVYRNAGNSPIGLSGRPLANTETGEFDAYYERIWLE